ncbi:NAC transcription factor 29 [Morus notabilis]|uniref:NAC transcription factor 29 n=1 Tax=Morus notabilis TaxID=981085 RepID=UPI000CED0B0C|nr:NAC transcription factor 29 [Morus notabilis]
MEITPVNLFPIGIRFSPTEVELVDYYLANKVMNKPFQDPTNRFQELELYNYTPKKLQEKYGVQKEHEMYIFVKRVLKHQKGKRLQRRITDGSNGFWKASTGEVKIELDGVLVGHRRTLVYYKGEGEKTNWLMYEYRLPDHYFVQLDDWLLCKVYLNKKEETKSKTRLNSTLESIAIINTNIDIQQAEYSSASHASFNNDILQ